MKSRFVPRAFSIRFCFHRIAIGAVILFAGIATSASADIIIDGYTAATNNRFTNDPSFIMSGFDLSGVARQSAGRWATAISRNVVISAWHFQPMTGQAVTFYEDNDPNGTPVTRNVLANTRIPDTDFSLSVLDANLPNSIAHYDYANQVLTGANNSFVNAGVYQGLNSVMFGVSPETQAAQIDQAVGRNLISGYIENIVGANLGSNQDLLIMLRDAVASPDHVPYEAFLQGGDSGGPLFAIIGGNLRLLGTNAVIGTFNVGGGQTIDFSGINYIGNQSAFIDSFIIDNAVPEPTSVTLLLVAIVGLARVRQHRADQLNVG